MTGQPRWPKQSIRLVVRYLQRVLADPHDAEAREALGLATDLGGYAIMIGGTNGAHLTSFSLVDVLSHGRACAMLNPYWTVFFAPAIEEPLRLVGRHLPRSRLHLSQPRSPARPRSGPGRGRGDDRVRARDRLPDPPGRCARLHREHIARALAAAKNPQLKSKLENMPVAMTAEMVDDYMGPVLEAAKTGNLSLIKNVN